MVGAALAQALASMAVAILQWYWGRKDIRDSERSKIALEGLEQINKALDWKAEHPVVLTDDPFGDFVQPDKPTTGPESNDPDKTGP